MIKLLTTAEAAMLIGWHPGTLCNRRMNKQDPEPTYLGRRRVFYTLEAIEDFIPGAGK